MYKALIILIFSASMLSAQTDRLNVYLFPIELPWDLAVEDEDSLLLYMDTSGCDTAIHIESRAPKDIESGQPLLLINVDQPALTKEDSLVQNEFGFQYSFFDPTYPFAPDNDHCDHPELYNLQIFEYLDEKYGRLWQLRVRTDIYAYQKINSR